jgi:membrane-associated phospholipid phosphatase
MFLNISLQQVLTEAVQIKGLGFAQSAANLFQLLCKIIVGSPRPHFYVVCRPAPWLRDATSTGYGHIYHTRDICANPNSSDRELAIAMTSFPSGHSVAAFAGFGYLALWINTKFADDKRSLWRLGLVITPVMLAGMMAWSKIADYWHHPIDVVAGAIIGCIFAYVVFRYQYSSVWAPKKTKEMVV